MGFDKVKIKQICLLVLYVAAVILLLLYSDVLFAGLSVAVQIFMPFIIGGAIAFILNIPMNGIEKRLFKKWQGKSAKALKRPISMVLSILFVIAIIGLVIFAVVPQLRTTFTTLGDKIGPFLDKVFVWLEALTTDYPQLTEQIQELEDIEFDWSTITNSIGGFLTSGVGSVVSSTVNVASSIVGGIAKFFIAFVFAIYILSQKEKLQNQAFRLLDAYAPKKWNGRIREVMHRLHVNFTNFICGQCLEAVILGLLFVIFMTIFGMPYAVMVGTLIAFTALIPIVGAFIGCGVGAFMILIENPMQALWFVIMFLIIQQLEGNLIYPRVVGNSVGLPSIWVLMSVSVGGSLFGVVGMLIFIPLMSTLYSLLKDDVNQRNARKMPKLATKAENIGDGQRRTYYRDKKKAYKNPEGTASEKKSENVEVARKPEKTENLVDEKKPEKVEHAKKNKQVESGKKLESVDRAKELENTEMMRKTQQNRKRNKPEEKSNKEE